MNATPYRWAVLLTLATIIGLVGMMVSGGLLDAVFLILAAMPLALGLAGWRRHRRTRIGAER